MTDSNNEKELIKIIKRLVKQRKVKRKRKTKTKRKPKQRTVKRKTQRRKRKVINQQMAPHIPRPTTSTQTRAPSTQLSIDTGRELRSQMQNNLLTRDIRRLEDDFKQIQMQRQEQKQAQHNVVNVGLQPVLDEHGQVIGAEQVERRDVVTRVFGEDEPEEKRPERRRVRSGESFFEESESESEEETPKRTLTPLRSRRLTTPIKLGTRAPLSPSKLITLVKPTETEPPIAIPSRIYTSQAIRGIRNFKSLSKINKDYNLDIEFTEDDFNNEMNRRSIKREITKRLRDKNRIT